MSSVLTRVLRLPGLARAATTAASKRGITSKPARNPMSTGEALVGFSAFVVCFMIPSGWVLSNMESYKKRD
ncbi:hypothetical protein FKM82_023039 [Ascaphus truei]